MQKDIVFGGSGIIKISNPDRMEERDETDFYPTPSPLIISIYELLDKHFGGFNGDVIDPGCGTGRWGVHAGKYDVNITGIEIDATRFRGMQLEALYNQVIYNDFLLITPDKKYDWVVGNPPFKFINAWIDSIHKWLKPGGQAAILAPISIMASMGRTQRFSQGFAPINIFNLVPRPNFRNVDENGKEDYSLAAKTSYPSNYVIAVFKNVYNTWYTGHSFNWFYTKEIDGVPLSNWTNPRDPVKVSVENETGYKRNSIN